MPRFDRYVLSQLLVVFGFFSLVLISVYWVNRAVSLFDNLVGDGQSLLVFLEFTALALPNVIRVVLPVSAFAAAVYVTNRLASESELVVMQATGLSAMRMARPVLYFGLIVALFLTLLMHVLMPASRAQLSERQAEIAENITARMLSEGDFLHPARGVTFYIRTITEEGALEDVFLSDGRSGNVRTDYTSKRAVLVPGAHGPQLVMLDGIAQVFDHKDSRLAVLRFDDLTYDVGALISPAGRGADLRALDTATLFRADPEDLRAVNARRAEFLHEAWTRLAHPFLALAAAMIGFATLRLGAFSRFGFWRQIVGAVTLLILVQLANNALSGIALRDARMAPLTFGPVVLGGAMALGMLWKADAARRPAHQRGRGGQDRVAT